MTCDELLTYLENLRVEEVEVRVRPDGSVYADLPEIGMRLEQPRRFASTDAPPARPSWLRPMCGVIAGAALWFLIHG